VSPLPFGLLRDKPRGDIDAFFGKLEVRVLEALWARAHPASVKELQPSFPNIAYTTLMTTLQRLHHKGVLERVKAGRAFLYRPRCSREQLRVGLAEDALGVILGPSVSCRPILSFFVEAVSRGDKDALDELERLVRERQREQQRGAK
jgi:BlaI family transcriptional regulator, penicillinase repressor